MTVSSSVKLVNLLRSMVSVSESIPVFKQVRDALVPINLHTVTPSSLIALGDLKAFDALERKTEEIIGEIVSSPSSLWVLGQWLSQGCVYADITPEELEEILTYLIERSAPLLGVEVELKTEAVIGEETWFVVVLLSEYMHPYIQTK